MKYIIACLFGLGLISSAMAQVPDSSPSATSYTCYYENGKAFKCDKKGRMETSQEKIRNEDVSSFEHGVRINSESRNLDNKENEQVEPEIKICPKPPEYPRHSEPEKESDTGVMGEEEQ